MPSRWQKWIKIRIFNIYYQSFINYFSFPLRKKVSGKCAVIFLFFLFISNMFKAVIWIQTNIYLSECSVHAKCFITVSKLMTARRKTLWFIYHYITSPPLPLHIQSFIYPSSGGESGDKWRRCALGLSCFKERRGDLWARSLQASRWLIAAVLRGHRRGGGSRRCAVWIGR